MQVVIKIDEARFKDIQRIAEVQLNRRTDTVEQLIAKGTPLPKGHGRLKDADEILKAMNTWDKFGYTETGCFVREPQNDYVPYVHYEDMVKAVNGAPTIIEADADGDNAICGCCNRLNHLYGTYCKHCGAKMVEPQESEEVCI